MNQYRGIFTSDRADGARDRLTDSGIVLEHDMPVGDDFPVTPKNTIAKVKRTELVALPDGTKARRAYFDTDRMLWPGVVPCIEGRLLDFSPGPNGSRIITSCLVTGIVLRPDPVGYDGDLEILDGDTWRVVTPPREAKSGPC